MLDFFIDTRSDLCYNLFCVMPSFRKKVLFMIEVTRLRGAKVILNAELIETVEGTPDTVITLTGGKKLVVEETPEQIVSSVIEYKRKIFHCHGTSHFPGPQWS